MPRPLAVASAAWTVAILAAIAGVLVPSDDLRLPVALFAFAVALAMLVALVLVADGLHRRRARRLAGSDGLRSPLGRLEYLPSVTTGTPRLHWRGSRYRVTSGREARPGGTPQVVDAGQAPPIPSELKGAANPRTASSTMQQRTDEGEATPRAP